MLVYIIICGFYSNHDPPSHHHDDHMCRLDDVIVGAFCCDMTAGNRKHLASKNKIISLNKIITLLRNLGVIPQSYRTHHHKKHEKQTMVIPHTSMFYYIFINNHQRHGYCTFLSGCTKKRRQFCKTSK
uniref:Uncharacterized protein n=1 Tax=Drosophila-associated filamentous virus TaxID=2743186 RepID=A0A6M9U075_9VIRU|nr:putative protein 12 [Drosophila-associated filamentous virus]